MSTLSLLTALFVSAAFVQSPETSSEVRVGIVAYEDFHQEYTQFDQLFVDMMRLEPTLRFKLAVGTYGDVLHWIDRQQVDVAILTPGVFAGLLSYDNESWETRMCTYLATVQLPRARSRYASPERQARGFFDHYQSVCLVPNSSPLRTVEDLRRLAEQASVEYLFVHPLSLSGYAAPVEALRRAQIKRVGVPTRFTYSHSQSIRMLSNTMGKPHRVAFVWDDATGNDSSLEEGIRKLPFPQLDQIRLPHDVIVTRKNFPLAERLGGLLLSLPEGERPYHFAHLDQWQQDFAEAHKWLSANGAISASQSGQRVALDEIGHLLLQYARSQPQPPRLALVLSGGGAKCSYQVGAVEVIEQKLSQLRRENPQHQIDIDLVVGTSGGAINSLPVALGITGSPAGREAFRNTWVGLNQCEIVRPPLVIRIYMGIWFALLQTAVVIWIVKWGVRNEQRRGWAFAAVYTALAGIEVLLGYVAPPPWSLLGSNHVWHHAWLWFSFAVRASAWSLFAIGVGALALQTVRSRRGEHIRLPQRFTRTLLVTGLLGLPLLQLISVLAFQETLSLGKGMEDALAQKFPRLINRYLESRNDAPLDEELAWPAGQALKECSRQIIQRGLLKRDLVITGSCLDQTSEDLPTDLYFFAPANQDKSITPYGERGLSLLAHPQILLDVIMGSGSIYPIFPARRIDDIPRPGAQIELVDGGFAHNSPVEAAVLWGATHIILIDVTPRGRIKRGNFLQNITSSVRHLHRQAQLLDSRSRGKVTIFTLSPEPPHVCIIDFADNLVADSIDRGSRDASLHAPGIQPRFEREVGEPVFVPVAP